MALYYNWCKIHWKLTTTLLFISSTNICLIMKYVSSHISSQLQKGIHFEILDALWIYKQLYLTLRTVSSFCHYNWLRDISHLILTVLHQTEMLRDFTAALTFFGCRLNSSNWKNMVAGGIMLNFRSFPFEVSPMTVQTTFWALSKKI